MSSIRPRALRSKKTRLKIIVSNDAANRNLARVVVVPVTSNTGKAYPSEALVSIGGQASKAMAADKTQLKGPLGSLTKADMLAV